MLTSVSVGWTFLDRWRGIWLSVGVTRGEESK